MSHSQLIVNLRSLVHDDLRTHAMYPGIEQKTIDSYSDVHLAFLVRRHIRQDLRVDVLDCSDVPHVGPATFHAIATHPLRLTLRELKLNNLPELNSARTGRHVDFTENLEASTFHLLQVLQLDSSTEIDQMPIGNAVTYHQVPITTNQFVRLFRACPALTKLSLRGRVLVNDEFFRVAAEVGNGFRYPFDAANYTEEVCRIIVRNCPSLRTLNLLGSVGSFFTDIFDLKSLNLVTLPNFTTSLADEPNDVFKDQPVSLRRMIHRARLGFCCLDRLADELQERAMHDPVDLPPQLEVVDIGTYEVEKADVLQHLLHYIKSIRTIILRDDRADNAAESSTVTQEWANLSRNVLDNPDFLMTTVAQSEEPGYEAFKSTPWASIAGLAFKNVRSVANSNHIVALLGRFGRSLQSITFESCGPLLTENIVRALRTLPRLKSVTLVDTYTSSPQVLPVLSEVVRETASKTRFGVLFRIANEQTMQLHATLKSARELKSPQKSVPRSLNDVD